MESATQPVDSDSLATLKPPVAKRIPMSRQFHGDTLHDDYAWLANIASDADVSAYIEAENAYTNAKTAPQARLRDRLFDEIKERTQETDLSMPYRNGTFWYYNRTEQGKQYSIFCRIPLEDEQPPSLGNGGPLSGEQVLLDENKLAAGHKFFNCRSKPSPDGRRLAYAVDTTGNELFTIHVRQLGASNDHHEELPDKILDTSGCMAWSLDASVLFYQTRDAAMRTYRLWRHALGNAAGLAQDVLLFEEADERFSLGDVELSLSKRFILVATNCTTASEVLAIPADAPNTAPVRVLPRREGFEYSVTHYLDWFLILHNGNGAEDFCLASLPVAKAGSRLDEEDLTTLIPHESGTRLISTEAFANHLVISLRRDALTRIKVVQLQVQTDTHSKPQLTLGAGYEVKFDEPLFQAYLSSKQEFHSPSIRFKYVSFITPSSVYDCDLATGALTLRKRHPVLGGFSSDNYQQEREWAVAADGAKVPLSLVWRRGSVQRDGKAPMVLYGYGSYEISSDPWFSVSRLSLLDRGVVWAVAHVRGGGEMGRRWYEEGRLKARKNSFTDFISSAEHLVERGWTARGRLVADGASAGGLLVGAVANTAPEGLFAGMVAVVPFVDVLNTMLDPSIPLTVGEWELLGNPLEDADAYALIKSYSPVDQVQAGRRYPAILAVSSLNDTRVSYAEAARWVARLRALAPDADVLLRTQMEAGHSGASGRYSAWKDAVFELAWLLDKLAAFLPSAASFSAHSS